MKLVLGTAQFGLAYGIASPQPQVNFNESKSIIDYSFRQGVTMLDTAIGYGVSEARLGVIGISGWKVISKVPEVPIGASASNWITDAVKTSLERLNIRSLYGLLLHRPSQLLTDKGPEILSTLERLKIDGLVEKVGISIYQPSELEDLFSISRFDLVQSPISVLDQRLITSGWLNRLTDYGVEVHARSVFLQGLLLMTEKQRPKKFNRWASLWNQYDAWVKASGLSSLQACLTYVASIPQIQHVVVGVNSLDHIKEILNTQTYHAPLLTPDLATEDDELLNPLSWLNF